MTYLVKILGSKPSRCLYERYNSKNASFKGANMKDLIAYATRFDNADLSDANLTNGELMKSVFDANHRWDRLYRRQP